MAAGDISGWAHVLLLVATGSRKVGHGCSPELSTDPCPTFGDRWISKVGHGLGRESWDDHVLLWPLFYCALKAIADFVPGDA